MSDSRRSPSRKAAFRNAFAGWGYVLRSQPNTWIHALATLAVVALSWWLHLGRRDWSILVLAIGLVWCAELLNTALEVVIDLVSPDFHPLARKGKDISAAAVVAAATSAAVVGFLILAPPLWAKVQTFLDTIKGGD